MGCSIEKNIPFSTLYDGTYFRKIALIDVYKFSTNYLSRIGKKNLTSAVSQKLIIA